MNFTPTKSQFHLKKVKYIASEAALQITGHIDIHLGAINSKWEMSGDKFHVEPHPDLHEQLALLKRPLARLHGLLDVEALIERKEFKGNAEQKAYAKKHTEEKLKLVRVTGISLAGEDQTRGVVITGLYDDQAINGKKFNFNQESKGFEKECETICDAIFDEVYEYLVNGKKGQMEAFTKKKKKTPLEKEIEKASGKAELQADSIHQAAKNAD